MRSRAVGREKVTAREMLEQATRRLRTELAAEPAIQADLLDAVARIDLRIGLRAVGDARRGVPRAWRARCRATVRAWR